MAVDQDQVVGMSWNELCVKLGRRPLEMDKSMSDKKIVVPEGMLQAAMGISYVGDDLVDELRKRIEAALRWWSKNPTAPTTDQAMEIGKKFSNQPSVCDYVMQVCAEWQRRCFLAPGPEVPEEIKDLLYEGKRVGCSNPQESSRFIEESDRRVLEAYRRGKEGK